jgi:hypothetical protein
VSNFFHLNAADFNRDEEKQTNSHFGYQLGGYCQVNEHQLGFIPVSSVFWNGLML